MHLISLLFHYSYYFRLRIISFFSTFYCRIFFRIRGIEIKKEPTFFGIPFIYKFPGSQIKFGNRITIRTSPISNLIGINRRTIISTHSSNAEVRLGDYCGLSGVAIAAKQSIIIGNNVMIGANVLITDFDWHSLDPMERKKGVCSMSKPIVISNNVFIGYSATILKGVTIGQNSVIGANSIVTSNIPPNVIAAGNPCKVISQLKYGKDSEV